MDSTDVFIVTHTRKDGKPVNDACAAVIDKLSNLKSSISSSIVSPHIVAAKDDFYAQILGEDKPGRVRELGTGPTPSSLWGSRNEQLMAENYKLTERMTQLEEKFENMQKQMDNDQGCNGEKYGSPPVELSSVASRSEKVAGFPTSYEAIELQGKRVKLLDLYGDVVAVGIVMNIDRERVVMGRELGSGFCEVSIIFVTKPDVPLVVKDHHRKTMKDAVGSHIPWLIDCIRLDLSRRSILQEDE